MEKQSNKIIWTGLILGLCLIAAASIASFTFYSLKQTEDTIAVTGSVRQQVTSDLAKWNAAFSTTVLSEDLISGYKTMKNDQEIVLQFFKDSGFEEKDIIISPVFMEQIYLYDSNAPKEIILRQNIEVKSSDVLKITSVAKNVQKLIDAGVIFQTQYIEYYYTQLPELRISLIPDAIEDAKLRAEKIAEGSGKVIGSIKSANLGVVQVLPVHSTEVTDWGTYDTSTIEKEIMLTVTGIFVLK